MSDKPRTWTLERRRSGIRVLYEVVVSGEDRAKIRVIELEPVLDLLEHLRARRPSGISEAKRIALLKEHGRLKD